LVNKVRFFRKRAIGLWSTKIGFSKWHLNPNAAESFRSTENKLDQFFATFVTFCLKRCTNGTEGRKGRKGGMVFFLTEQWISIAVRVGSLLRLEALAEAVLVNTFSIFQRRPIVAAIRDGVLGLLGFCPLRAKQRFWGQISPLGDGYVRA